MNVTELIMRLRKVEDKSKDVRLLPIDTDTLISVEVHEEEDSVTIT